MMHAVATSPSSTVIAIHVAPLRSIVIEPIRANCPLQPHSVVLMLPPRKHDGARGVEPSKAPQTPRDLFLRNEHADRFAERKPLGVCCALALNSLDTSWPCACARSVRTADGCVAVCVGDLAVLEHVVLGAAPVERPDPDGIASLHLEVQVADELVGVG